jgi:NIMA (never in mitosis gene a)-related kinase
MHRDIKTANCFVAADGSVKLGDMNISKMLKNDMLLKTQIGTPYYMSPEIWANQPYGPASDVW